MFISVLPNYHIILLPKTNKQNLQSKHGFSFAKTKIRAKKIPNNPFKAWIHTASYCGSKLMRKTKKRWRWDTFDCRDFFNPASQTCSSKKQGKWYHNILSNSAKSKGLTIKSYLPTIKKLLSSTRKSQFMKRKSLPLSTLSSQFWISREQEFKWHYDRFQNSLPYQPSPLYQVCHYQLSQSASLKIKWAWQIHGFIATPPGPWKMACQPASLNYWI